MMHAIKLLGKVHENSTSDFVIIKMFSPILYQTYQGWELTKRKLIKIRVLTFSACLSKTREKCLYDIWEILLNNYVRYSVDDNFPCFT